MARVVVLSFTFRVLLAYVIGGGALQGDYSTQQQLTNAMASVKVVEHGLFTCDIDTT